eukprot:c15902_g2_i1.p1 GENE.c15902_g2_i1~~c15902_g2_i1.p1  ORF type:complete len:508 (-),score=261.50 c15902_g2_i1:73-1518(-)
MASPDADIQPFASITYLRERILNKSIKCVDLLEFFVSRVERLDGEVHAIAVKDLERARQRAKLADEALAKGENWGPLHGIPMTVKECHNVEGLPTSEGYEDRRSPVSANAVGVQRLIDAGAIIWGKSNLPVGCLDWETYNPIYGKTRNPYDLTRSPGGSSGGSAAAVACGFTPMELGSDVAGSIRVPATYCGVMGIAPTFDLIPDLLASSMSVTGPLARYPEDLSILIQVLAGPAPYLSNVVKWSLPLPTKKSLKEYKIAIIENSEFCPVGLNVENAIKKVTQIVQSQGGVSTTSALPVGFGSHSLTAYMRLLSSGFCQPASEVHVPQIENANMNQCIDLWEQGKKQSHGDWLAARKAQYKFQNDLREFWKDWDVIVCPITLDVAFTSQEPEGQDAYSPGRVIEIDGKTRPYSDMFFWPHMAIFAQTPATSFPAARSETGLPIGLQVIAPSFHDHISIHVAGLLMRELGTYDYKPPQVATS